MVGAMVVIIFIIIATQPIWHFLSRTGCGATRSEFKIFPLYPVYSQWTKNIYAKKRVEVKKNSVEYVDFYP